MSAPIPKWVDQKMTPVPCERAKCAGAEWKHVADRAVGEHGFQRQFQCSGCGDSQVLSLVAPAATASLLKAKK